MILFGRRKNNIKPVEEQYEIYRKYVLGTHYIYKMPENILFFKYLELKDDIDKADGTFEKISNYGYFREFVIAGGKPILARINQKELTLETYREMPKNIIDKYKLTFVGTNHLEGIKRVMDNK